MRSNAEGSLATTCASCLRGQDAEAKRPNAHRVAHGDDGVFGQEEERVGAANPGERVGDAILDGDLFADGDEVDEDLGVGVALEDRPARFEIGAELFRVGQVSVVADGERPARIVDRERLRILDVRRTRRRVTDVPDGHAALAARRADPG